MCILSHFCSVELCVSFHISVLWNGIKIDKSFRVLKKNSRNYREPASYKRAFNNTDDIISCWMSFFSINLQRCFARYW